MVKVSRRFVYFMEWRKCHFKYCISLIYFFFQMLMTEDNTKYGETVTIFILAICG